MMHLAGHGVIKGREGGAWIEPTNEHDFGILILGINPFPSYAPLEEYTGLFQCASERTSDRMSKSVLLCPDRPTDGEGSRGLRPLIAPRREKYYILKPQ